jgi:hypothetical protein
MPRPLVIVSVYGGVAEDRFNEPGTGTPQVFIVDFDNIKAGDDYSFDADVEARVRTLAGGNEFMGGLYKATKRTPPTPPPAKKAPKGLKKYVVMEAQTASRVEYYKHTFYAKPGLTEAQALKILNSDDATVESEPYGEPDETQFTGDKEQVLVTDTKSEDEAVEEAADMLSNLGFR